MHLESQHPQICVGIMNTVEEEHSNSSAIDKETQFDKSSLTPHSSLRLQDLQVATVIATSRAAVLAEELHAAQSELRQKRLQAIALEAHNRILQIQLDAAMAANAQLVKRSRICNQADAQEEINQASTVSDSASAVFPEHEGEVNQKIFAKLGKQHHEGRVEFSACADGEYPPKFFHCNDITNGEAWESGSYRLNKIDQASQRCHLKKRILQ
ncbi:hypothetical protein CEUSTIGMA_g7495.t1 [Chlamydomonas eustigma]|uniref:Uncharacterized protein n=1 Tax=Chlamydomonas eustigma TaxID=1157962 RepID=A0A250XAJ0_9CHLO|nr:hypothetical protein CEUSTIGMA_g7495.t1 [Chlamydomonas eustigma]|eukprot:GAX80056.1 hypothetical protein CEUSTIGMA_g7495.t1 [Chlamydomonas eustigma]